MHFGLTTEQLLLLDSARGFVERELLPYEEEVERIDRVRSGRGRCRSAP